MRTTAASSVSAASTWSSSDTVSPLVFFHRTQVPTGCAGHAWNFLRSWKTTAGGGGGAGTGGGGGGTAASAAFTSCSLFHFARAAAILFWAAAWAASSSTAWAVPTRVFSGADFEVAI